MKGRSLRILGTGVAVPERCVTDAEMERQLGLPTGWMRKTGGVERRYFVESETASQLGAMAARRALDVAGLKPTDIGLILCGSGTQQQPIPCTAAFVQRELGLGDSGVPAFDINATCLSFLVALDTASHFIEAGAYRRILIVSPEVASAGLNPDHKESYTILGDGAGAVVVGHAGDTDSRFLKFKLSTWGSQAELCQIQGGGSKLYATKLTSENRARYLFEMDGMGSFKFVSQVIEEFMAGLFEGTGWTLADVDLVVPHQASRLALDLIIRRRLGIRPERFVDVLSKYGNTIAASIPIAMHEAIEGGRIRRGSRLLFLGSSAGLSLGGALLTF